MGEFRAAEIGMLRNGLIQDMRRDVCAERCESVADPFVSVRTCESEGLTGKSGAVDLLRRVLDAGEHTELLSSLMANTGLLRDNYDLIVSLFSNVVNKDTIDILRNLLVKKNYSL